MKYQALKSLKTKNKLLALTSTLAEAHEEIKRNGGQFVEFSYMGGFPIYQDEAGKTYSIQGLVEGMNIVCSLNDKELKAFNFSR